mgnify:CR=1 FL=1
MPRPSEKRSSKELEVALLEEINRFNEMLQLNPLNSGYAVVEYKRLNDQLGRLDKALKKLSKSLKKDMNEKIEFSDVIDIFDREWGKE